MTNNMLWGLLLMMEVLPVLYLVVGLALLRRPPKLGKGFFSYRNFVSKKDEAHWRSREVLRPPAHQDHAHPDDRRRADLYGAPALLRLQRRRVHGRHDCPLAEFISVFVCQTITAHKLEAQFHDMRDAMKDDD